MSATPPSTTKPQSSAPLVQYEERAKGVKPSPPQVNADVAPVEQNDYTRLVLAAAGLDPEKAGQHLRQALDKFVETLNAQSTQYFSKDGVVTDERTLADTTAQLRAAAELRDTVDRFFGQRSSATGQGDARIVVNVGWFDGPSDERS